MTWQNILTFYFKKELNNLVSDFKFEIEIFQPGFLLFQGQFFDEIIALKNETKHKN